VKITLLMIATYIIDCILIGTKPCKVFQLNSWQFNREDGIFSKVEIDEHIPEKWRLAQRHDDGLFEPQQWPVFVKPEWGQNANGVKRADDLDELKGIRAKRTSQNIKYLIQTGSPSSREFEVFSIRHHQDRDRYAIFTVTEAVNSAELNPVNSINNGNSRYVEITDELDEKDRATLWEMVNQLGRYNISRASLSANSIEALLAGQFHVIEINLFLPMPINLLDEKYSIRDIFSTVFRYMMCLAKITKYRDKSLAEKPVFTKIMTYNRQSAVINFLRAKL
jgi:hypothetical protein